MAHRPAPRAGRGRFAHASRPPRLRIAEAAMMPDLGGALPRTRPGGFASWTSTKGFALGTPDFCAAQREWDPRALWPLVGQGRSPCLPSCGRLPA
ncbi:protein of unknown function [Rhodovastum atsumiense]|nr:protein of unknown function [Rhodovastum atsumiense]